MFYSAQLFVSKPDPEFFPRLCTLTGFHGNELVFVDDPLANLTVVVALSWKTTHWTGNPPTKLFKKHSLE
jgi:HAD superfamily hydrolase (TIGR01509 family)